MGLIVVVAHLKSWVVLFLFDVEKKTDHFIKFFKSAFLVLAA